MDEHRARELITTERARVEGLLAETARAAREDRSAEDEPGDIADAAAPLTAEGVDDALVATLRERLEALGRAQARLDAGTFGLSVRSGLPIPEERLEADPAAELTAEEASGA